MAFDYSKLHGKIREKCKTQAEFAKRMGMSRTTLSAKLNNNSEFTQQEINKATELLNLQQIEIPIYFFVIEVQKTEQD